jgi:hypothetical protein
MFKVRYIFECTIDDEEIIELYFSQLYFDYFMGRIMLEDEYMFMLAAIIKIIKYYDKSLAEIYMAILPLWLSNECKREETLSRIEFMLKRSKIANSALLKCAINF